MRRAGSPSAMLLTCGGRRPNSLPIMVNRLPPQIDVLPDGSYREIPVRGPSLVTQVGRYALVVAVLAGVVALASLAFWLAISLIPIAIGAGLVAWAAFRFRVWQMSRNSSFRGPPDIFRR